MTVATREGVAIGLWVASERLAQLRCVHPDASMAPVVEPAFGPATGVGAAGGDPTPGDRDDALRELLRSRLGGLGPIAVDALATPLGVAVDEAEASLLQLQAEGVVLQGRFSSASFVDDRIEWCERHLLARIHRYTLKRLRREIEPVEPRDYARFLFEWQHVAVASRVSGPEALAGTLAQLEGYEAPAPLWESEILPARMTDYAPRWLDELCTAGRTQWMRLRPPASDHHRSGGTSLRSTPILVLPRRAAPFWTALAPAAGSDDGLGSRARRVAGHLSLHGASFFDDIAGGTRLLRAEVEDALSELVVRGRARCDSFAGLRALLVPPSKRSSGSGRRGRVAWFGIEDAGRWSLMRAASATAADEPPVSPSAPRSIDAAEQVARLLLRRYGVLCWRLLEREPAWLPPWRDIVRACRRLEARGEIRGGRFIAGLSGEQYALPDAVALMRQVRRQPLDGALVCLAAADPANVLGTILPGPRIARVGGARVLFRDGLPLAALAGGEIGWLADVDAAEKPALRRALELGPSTRFDAIAAGALLLHPSA